MAAQPVPAWCSLGVRDLLTGPVRDGAVVAAGPRAGYVLCGVETAGPGGPDVVALVGAGGVRLPIAIQPRTFTALPVGQPARVGGGLLRVGGASWAPVRWWNPRPDVHPASLAAAGPLLRAELERRRVVDYGAPADEAADAVVELAHGRPEAAVRLLGLGPGFTPAGDDVVAGALAALALLGSLRDGVVLGLLEAARDRTTTISAALLSAAAKGQVVPPAAAVLQAAARGDRGGLASAYTALLAVGATSGAALALGIATAVAACATSEMESR